MAVDDATWAEIRRCYCDGAESVGRMAARFEVSVWQIRYRAKCEGWWRVVRERVDTVDTLPWTPSEDDEEPPPRQRREREPIADVTREEVVARLYRAIVRKLDRLEERMDNGKEINVAESERETRELSTMVRSFEKVTGVADDIAKERKPERRKPSDGDAASADAERMRREIAERLERLNAQWESETASRKSK